MKKTYSLMMFFLFMTFTLSSCSSGGSDTPASPAPLKVFVTSVYGNGDLSGWADAGGAHGVVAGDAVCQARATAAGLSGTYKAWLSDSTTDAYCHIQGYDGHTISDNCGQGTLPVAAGPWVRTDGYPFADTIDKLINNHQVYAPVRYNETGALVTSGDYFTGTSIDGTGGSTCDGWTNGLSGSATTGSRDGATSGWTAAYGMGCSATARLLCFQTGTGGPLPSITAPALSKKVFVTSVTGTGDLHSWSEAGGASGLVAGDTICQARATARSIPNAANFKAWLSDDTTNAIDRLTSAGPWYRMDGVKVADSKADLTDQTLFTAISYTEMGAYIDVPYYNVWTGTGDNGARLAGSTCSNWGNSTSGVNGIEGFATIADSNWTSWAAYSCDHVAALYCFED